VFSAPAEPPPDVVGLIDARKAEISEFLRPDAVQRRLDAEADLLRAPPPPDVSDINVDDDDVEFRVDVRWKAALKGLRAFLAAGHGDEALRLGWSRDELYAVPPVWSRVDQCGVGLLIGDSKVTEITAARIQIKTAGGVPQSFYRAPTVDYALVYRSRLKLIEGSYPAGSDEPRLRAIEHTVNEFRRNTGADLGAATVAVHAAIKGEPR
jgi:hypothetical protein